MAIEIIEDNALLELLRSDDVDGLVTELDRNPHLINKVNWVR